MAQVSTAPATAPEIKGKLMWYYRMIRHLAVCDEVMVCGCREDVVVQMPSGFTAIEVKVSMSDFKRDSKKSKATGHGMTWPGAWNTGWRRWYTKFFYAAPPELAERIRQELLARDDATTGVMTLKEEWPGMPPSILKPAKPVAVECTSEFLEKAQKEFVMRLSYIAAGRFQ